MICALLSTRFKGMQIVTCPTNYQTTKVMLTKEFPKVSGHMQMNKQWCTVHPGYTLAPQEALILVRVEGQ